MRPACAPLAPIAVPQRALLLLLLLLAFFRSRPTLRTRLAQLLRARRLAEAAASRCELLSSGRSTASLRKQIAIAARAPERVGNHVGRFAAGGEHIREEPQSLDNALFILLQIARLCARGTSRRRGLVGVRSRLPHVSRAPFRLCLCVRAANESLAVFLFCVFASRDVLLDVVHIVEGGVCLPLSGLFAARVAPPRPPRRRRCFARSFPTLNQQRFPLKETRTRRGDVLVLIR